LSHDYVAEITGGQAYIFNISPDPVSYSFAAYAGTIINISSINSNHRGNTQLSLSLIIGSGFVRWQGTMMVQCAQNYRTLISQWAYHEVAIYRNCPTGTIDPRGDYTVSSVIRSQLTYGVAKVTSGSSIYIA